MDIPLPPPNNMNNHAIRKVSQRTSKRTNKEKLTILPSQNVLFIARNYMSVMLEKHAFKCKYIYEEVLPLPLLNCHSQPVTSIQTSSVEA